MEFQVVRPTVGRGARTVVWGGAGDSPAPLGDSPSGMGRRHRWPERLMSLTALPLSSGDSPDGTGVARATRPLRSATRRVEWGGVTDGQSGWCDTQPSPFRRATRPTGQG